MTIGTMPLTATATWHEINTLISFMMSLSIVKVTVTYGWGCQASDIEQPVVVPLDALVELLHNNIAQAIYHLGEDNLYIETFEAADPALKITLCHDADIHVEARDAALEAQLRAAWEGRGIRVWPQ